jgi:NAD(P)-dependent dehydrogenase (short-subunit alcohol dehydrogenase family)
MKESSFLFAKHGAKVVVVDINTKKGEEVVDTIKKWGGAATFVHADISKASDVEKVINTAEKVYPTVPRHN